MTDRVPRVVPHFHEALEGLKERLLVMGGLAEERVRACLQALVERDEVQAGAVRRGDAPVNRLHVDIDQRCVALIALNQPMAADLRAIVAAVKINTDLERVGDLAVNIAEAVLRYLAQPPVPGLLDIPRMADLAQRMLRDALDAYVRRDLTLADQVLAADDSLDALKAQVHHALVAQMRAEPSIIEPALDLLLVSRHLERIGDHATNIAEDVIFMVTARDVRHSGQEDDDAAR
jgi:phosphate transport system protein